MEELFFRIIEFLGIFSLENYLIFATIGAHGGIVIANIGDAVCTAL